MEFAVWLRDAKRRADLTYEQIARRAGYAVTTVQEACNGRRIPSLKVTQAIARACDQDAQAWGRYWAELHQLQDRRDNGQPVTVPAPPWAVVIDLTDDATHLALDSQPLPAPNAPQAEQPVATEAARSWSRRRRAIAAAVVLAIVVSVGVAVSRHTASGHPAVGLPELEFNRSGVSTFSDPYTPAGTNSRIPFKATVRVTCKVLAPSLQSVSPDGYWYKIATKPWAGLYAPANTFLNGDRAAGPYTHSTDWHLPNC